MPISGVYSFEPDELKWILGAGKNAAADASPIRHITGKESPFLILYADSDLGRITGMSEVFGNSLRNAGTDVRCERLAHRSHLSILFRMMTDEADPVTQALLAFIAQHSELSLKPRPQTAGGQRHESES